jgi:teichuronic acid biosynthesis glycosyltransferase TuaC
LRVLVTDNMRPERAAPHRGSFVRDQVTALRRAGVEIEHASFPPGNRGRAEALRGLRRILAERRFDLVHAHFGLSGWCAKLAGASPLAVTFHGTDVRHPATGILTRRLVRRIALVAGASRALFAREGGRPALPLIADRTAVLPCGADLERFRPLERSEARRRLALDPDRHYLLFPASPDRAVKRPDRARALAERAGSELLVAGGIEPDLMPVWVSAADAVLITSDNEGFGLAVVEALACDRPVLSTPVGIAPSLLRGLDGCLCAPFELEAWTSFLRRERERGERPVDGRERAAAFAADAMAARVLAAYRELLARDSAGSSHGRERSDSD